MLTSYSDKERSKIAMDRSNTLAFSDLKQMHGQVYNLMVDARVVNITWHILQCVWWLMKWVAPISPSNEMVILDDKYQSEKGMVPQVKASHSNEKDFTTLDFAILSAMAILCRIISQLVSEKCTKLRLKLILKQMQLVILQTLTTLKII